jgi:hypothetical protein
MIFFRILFSPCDPSGRHRALFTSGSGEPGTGSPVQVPVPVEQPRSPLSSAQLEGSIVSSVDRPRRRGQHLLGAASRRRPYGCVRKLTTGVLRRHKRVGRRSLLARLGASHFSAERNCSAHDTRTVTVDHIIFSCVIRAEIRSHAPVPAVFGRCNGHTSRAELQMQRVQFSLEAVSKYGPPAQFNNDHSSPSLKKAGM